MAKTYKQAMEEILNQHLVVKVRVFPKGLDIPKNKRWFDAPMSQINEGIIFMCLPMNIEDILCKRVDSSNGAPHIDGVATLINQYPKATFVYEGINDKIWGGGAHGETHWELAQQRAKELL